MKNKPINIEGIQLTESAIEELKSLQEHDNEKLDANVEDLAELVFYLIRNREYLNDEGKELDKHLGIIGFVRSSFINLRSKNKEGGQS
ncbi:hypothetical protein E9993_14670 [Labilibacter sediminis]|nr:hypothetical protein E9993_14670 [Labilibacter sediminis]